MSHPAIRTTAHEPCPFCGCARTPTRRTRSRRARYISPPGPSLHDFYPHIPRSVFAPRPMRSDELTYIASTNEILYRHRGETPILRDNALVGWKEATA